MGRKIRIVVEVAEDGGEFEPVKTLEGIETWYWGMVAGCDNLKDVVSYVKQFNGPEAIVATTVFHMTLNTVVNLLTGVDECQRLKDLAVVGGLNDSSGTTGN